MKETKRKPASPAPLIERAEYWAGVALVSLGRGTPLKDAFFLAITEGRQDGMRICDRLHIFGKEGPRRRGRR